MAGVRAKKHLGQHFLTDPNIAKDIVDAFGNEKNFKRALEIGPGMGVLTKFLAKRDDLKVQAVDIDQESIDFLIQHEILPKEDIIAADFLKMDLTSSFKDTSLGIIGNFPYNISSQILFKVYENKELIPECVGMFQKEVADRVVSPPGSKVYGITSVLLQAFYDIDYLFTVDKENFDPPPKVQSAVIRLRRNQTQDLGCDEKLFKRIVKMAFNQRRKTLRNSLKAVLQKVDGLKDHELFNQRPEQLGVDEFVWIGKQLSQSTDY